MSPADILLVDARYPIWIPLKDNDSLIKGNITETADDKTCFNPCPKERKYKSKFFLKYWKLLNNYEIIQVKDL